MHIAQCTSSFQTLYNRDGRIHTLHLTRTFPLHMHIAHIVATSVTLTLTDSLYNSTRQLFDLWHYISLAFRRRLTYLFIFFFQSLKSDSRKCYSSTCLRLFLLFFYYYCVLSTCTAYTHGTHSTVVHGIAEGIAYWLSKTYTEKVAKTNAPLLIRRKQMAHIWRMRVACFASLLFKILNGR